jgi:REP element-mobilizing transposase RayT
MWFGGRAYRRKVLVNGIDERLKQIMQEACMEYHATIEELEVMPDHVHLLVHCDPQFGIHRLVKLLKGRSSRLTARRNIPRCVPAFLPCGHIAISAPLLGERR